jgi:hypothetical protein
VVPAKTDSLDDELLSLVVLKGGGKVVAGSQVGGSGCVAVNFCSVG